MKRLVIGLALACSALATPAFATAPSSDDLSSATTAAAKADQLSVVQAIGIDQVTTSADIDTNAADYVFIPPVDRLPVNTAAPPAVPDRQAASFAVNMSMLPPMRYAVLVQVSISNPFGTDLDPVAKAKSIV